MKYLHAFLLIVFLFISACQTQPVIPYVYQAPTHLADGIPVGTLEQAGVDHQMITEAIEKIREGDFREIHSLLIYSQGKLVLEEYFSGYKFQWDAPAHRGELVAWDQSMSHRIMSDTKSITSACIGIAIEHGFINSVDQSIFDYLPEHQHLMKDGKEQITIEHLLTMTSGLDWYEWNAPYSSQENPIIGIWFSEKDPVSFILEADLKYSPGTHYSYYGGHQILLGEIIRHATGMAIDQFSEKYLFEPLGISNANWAVRFENGVIEAAGGLELKSRDMLKIGITFLNNGVWKGQQIIAPEWVAASARPYKENNSIKVPGEGPDRKGYSYSWWIDKIDFGNKEIHAFHAGGWGGQKIIVIPELQSVIVFTGGAYTTKVGQFKLLKKYLMPVLAG